MEECLDSVSLGLSTFTETRHNRLCPICSGEKFVKISEVTTSVWNREMGGELSRQWIGIPLGQCQGCGHQMLLDEYGPDLIQALYVPTFSGFTPNAFENHPEVHENVLTYMNPFLTISQPTVVDFGCGDFTLLKRISQGIERLDPQLIGIDFATARIDQSQLATNMEWICADLANLENSQNVKELKFDYGFMTHVLEHIPDPRKFLRMIRTMMKSTSFLYVEVPANELLGEGDLEVMELIIPQHVHYFTLNHLAMLFQTCGFSILQQGSCVTNGIPRAQMVVSKNGFEDEVSSVVLGQQKIQQTLQAVGNRIIQHIEQGSQVALWGVGADLETVCRFCPALREKIRANHVLLLDSFLHGKRWEQCVIHHPSILDSQPERRVVITPRPVHLRREIRELAIARGIDPMRIIDPYQK